MPSKQALALLVRIHVQDTMVRAYANGTHRLASTRERLDPRLIESLLILECLQISTPALYELTEKGTDIACHIYTRIVVSGFWGPGSQAGKKIHYWREYLAGQKYREYETACGISRLTIDAPALSRVLRVDCQKCLIAAGLAHPPATHPGDLLTSSRIS